MEKCPPIEYHSKILALSVNLRYKCHNLDKRNQSPRISVMPHAQGREISAGCESAVHFMGDFDPVLVKRMGFLHSI